MNKKISHVPRRRWPRAVSFASVLERLNDDDAPAAFSAVAAGDYPAAVFHNVVSVRVRSRSLRSFLRRDLVGAFGGFDDITSDGRQVYAAKTFIGEHGPERARVLLQVMPEEMASRRSLYVRLRRSSSLQYAKNNFRSALPLFKAAGIFY